MTPYLGPKTKESTSILQPWEKQIEIPLLRRACDLRKVINWFVESDSNLAKFIYRNLMSLTNLDLTEEITDYKRTGCSKHRLRCSTVSNEGSPAIGFNNLTYVTVTTDALNKLNEQNHDFMYQSLLGCCGVLSSTPDNLFKELETTHYHIVDSECIRPIQEEILENPVEFQFPDESVIVNTMLTQELNYKHLPRMPPLHF